MGVIAGLGDVDLAVFRPIFGIGCGGESQRTSTSASLVVSYIQSNQVS